MTEPDCNHCSSEMHLDVRSVFSDALACEHSVERHHALSSIVVLGHGVAQTSDWALSAALCRAAMTIAGEAA